MLDLRRECVECHFRLAALANVKQENKCVVNILRRVHNTRHIGNGIEKEKNVREGREKINGNDSMKSTLERLPICMVYNACNISEFCNFPKFVATMKEKMESRDHLNSFFIRKMDAPFYIQERMRPFFD